MTFIPALPSSAARMPPAAPAPTMTTSVFSVAMTLALPHRGLRLQTDHRRSPISLAALHVGGGKLRLRARKAHEAPTREVLVAAIDWVGEHALDGVDAHSVEESLCRRPGEIAGLAGVECLEHFILLGGAEPRERRLLRLFTIGVECSQAAPVEILQIGVGAGEPQIDVVEDAGIERARLSGRSRHQPFGEGGNRRGIFVVEERAMAGAR